MFCSDVVVPHAAGFFDGELQHFLDPRRKIDFAGACLSNAAQAFNHFLDPFRFHT